MVLICGLGSVESVRVQEITRSEEFPLMVRSSIFTSPPPPPRSSLMRFCAAAGFVSTLVGVSQSFFDGDVLTARFYYPMGLRVTPQQKLVVAVCVCLALGVWFWLTEGMRFLCVVGLQDTYNNRIRLVEQSALTDASDCMCFAVVLIVLYSLIHNMISPLIACSGFCGISVLLICADTISVLSSLDCGSINRRVLQSGEQFSCEVTVRSSSNEVMAPPPLLTVTTDQLALTASGDTSAVSALTFSIRSSPSVNVLLVTGTAAAGLSSRASFDIHVRVSSSGAEIAGSPASFAVNCMPMFLYLFCFVM